MQVAVISLKRTPERWSAFLQRNQQALKNCELLRIAGIDGEEVLSTNIKSKLISSSARKNWTAGAIGIGLSHLFCWQICCKSRSPLVILEDDTLLANDWQAQLKQLLDLSSKMVLLGWNLDSMLRSEFSNEQEIISLFEPAYPSEDNIRKIINSDDRRKKKRLRNSFGLPGYWLEPKMARQLLNRIKKLETLPLELGRGFPKIKTNGIDGLLNLHYHQLSAELVMPPLALALNNPITSLTKSGPSNFGDN